MDASATGMLRHGRRMLAFMIFAFSSAAWPAGMNDKLAQLEASPTALAADPGISVYAAGDIADCTAFAPADSFAAKTAAVIAERLAGDSQAVVLTLGDNVYPDGSLQEFIGCYQPTWGQFKDRTFPSPGNHDYDTPQASGYFGYFGSAASLAGLAPGFAAGLGYYSFNLGTWHVISLNSNLAGQEHQAQLEWLQADLARNPAPCTLAYWHYPLYSSGQHGNMQDMADAWAILYAAGADLVLVGHDHDYERFAPQDASGRRDDVQGIREIVVGTGGAELTGFSFLRPNSEAASSFTSGVLKLQLRQAAYDWQFLPIDNGGFTDSGTALCH